MNLRNVLELAIATECLQSHPEIQSQNQSAHPPARQTGFLPVRQSAELTTTFNHELSKQQTTAIYAVGLKFTTTARIELTHALTDSLEELITICCNIVSFIGWLFTLINLPEIRRSRLEGTRHGKRICLVTKYDF